MQPNEPRATADIAATRFRFGAPAQAQLRAIPVETPVNIVYAPLPYAVMMATPADLEDFALGFSLTEGVIERPEDIRAIAIEPAERGVRLVITLNAERTRANLARNRNMAGRTGCGICGIDDLASLPMAKQMKRVRTTLRVSAVRRALGELAAHQKLNDATHAVHGAAWCDVDGRILVAREDVGRHNALDKLIGALARQASDAATGFVLVTSRCSFEMVEKSAVFGAGAIVAISAPTSLAVERAAAHDMILIGVARADGVQCFSGADRVIDDLAATTRLSA